MRTHLIGIAALAATALTLGSAVAAQADDPSQTTDIGAAVSSATPLTTNEAAPVTPTVDTEVAVAYSAKSVDVTVPTDPREDISVSGGGGTFTVSLPAANAAESAQPVGEGSVSFDNNDGSTTVPVVVNDGSIQINTVIESASAPSDYRYEINVPGGGSLSADTDGAVSILDSRGDWVGGVAAPWAKDADGTALPTSYAIEGTTLVQHVDLSAARIAYPVVADPWFGIALIDHTTWANTWQYSPTLQVIPTWWGRNTGVAANGAAWSETLSKTSRWGHPNPDTAAMRTQFDCHWYAVRMYAPNKPSWDLDSKLPNTSLANEIRYGCNYPAGNREF